MDGALSQWLSQVGLYSSHRILNPKRGYMGGCQNYGPFLDPYSNTAPNI